MVTFSICFILLIVAYFLYGKYLERVIGIDPNHPTPAKTHYDGVDYLPLPQWKTFLIQLLNIAGLGPIFGALLGAMYGPVAFLWITLGGILIGGLHDYVSGMISMKKEGQSLPELVGHYLGNGMKQSMRIITLLLMVLVGAVFLVGPAGILDGMTLWSKSIWIWIILIYYILATLLPIDKIIGRIYPIFGAALFFMALGILYVLLFDDYAIPELSADNWRNFKSDAADFLHIEQRSIRKRLYISIPLFVIGFAITLMNFGVIWQYFAWINQMLAAVTLWTVTSYLIVNRKNYWIALLPAIFMTLVVTLYILIAPEGLLMPYWSGFAIASVITVAVTILFLRYTFRRRKNQMA